MKVTDKTPGSDYPIILEIQLDNTADVVWLWAIANSSYDMARLNLKDRPWLLNEIPGVSEGYKSQMNFFYAISQVVEKCGLKKRKGEI